MMDWGATIGSIKTAVETAKSIVKMQISIEVRQKVIELQTTILDMQSIALSAKEEQMLHQARIQELERELSEIRKSKAEADNYKLLSVSKGAIVYALKANILKKLRRIGFARLVSIERKSHICR